MSEEYFIYALKINFLLKKISSGGVTIFVIERFNFVAIQNNNYIRDFDLSLFF